MHIEPAHFLHSQIAKLSGDEKAQWIPPRQSAYLCKSVCRDVVDHFLPQKLCT